MYTFLVCVFFARETEREKISLLGREVRRRGGARAYRKRQDEQADVVSHGAKERLARLPLPHLHAYAIRLRCDFGYLIHKC